MAKVLNTKAPATGAGGDPSLDSVSSAAAASGIRRLEPTDGLFLRAEHLRQIEDYARDLSLANGIGGGPGVVYGYTLDLDPAGQVVGATAGLAIDPSGRPLQSLARLEADLSGLARSEPGRIWIVEVIAAEPIPAGSEPLYSAVCATPCGPQPQIQPWRDDAVQLRVRAQTLWGPWVNTRPTRRLLSALVSAYFDLERQDGDPWLTPSGPGTAVPGLGGRPWAGAAPESTAGPAGVPLGLLAWIDGKWVLDVWSARRDRLLSPPDTAWHNHLGLRPRPVFTAQVLQFTDQLAREAVDAKNPLPSRFVELPPAGFLPLPSGLGEGVKTVAQLVRWLEVIFQGAVQLSVELCSADVALSAVALAQHLDRIPLAAHAEKGPVVQILVPGIPADLPAVTTSRYGWVAFVRSPRIEWAGFERVPGERPQAPGGEPPATDNGPEGDEVSAAANEEAAAHEASEADEVLAADEVPAPAPEEHASVAVHVVEAPSFRGRYLNRVADTAALPAVTELSFPGQGWAPADDDQAMASIREAVTRDGGRLADMVVTTSDAEREPLMAARARALATRLGLGEPGTPVGVFPAVVDGPEAIYLMTRRPAR
ncbi:hypothetical protein [Oryzihumus sp.]|uniref:hypothetical protein n=1 Tax=Oryzihumus sp. TaxID=1968903 RepID=UPI002ED7BFE1